MDKYIGKRLDGRYEIQEILGIGGMAVVYKAYDNVDDRIVAVKILKDEFTGNDEFLRRFKNESKAIAVLSHPNVVKVSDVSFGDLIQYIVMEYIEGITLKEYIDQQGPLSWSDAVHFTLQILRGLQHAHDKGVVHRDIKPQNIMVLDDGTIKVTDFGIARFARSEQRTITDKAIGSVHYISPEQARGEKTDEKADIYSVGVMLYEMLTGQLPFQAESAVSVAIMQLQKDPTLPRDINGSIPLGLEQITMHAMQKETARRYRSAAEMLCDLEAFKKNPAVTFDYDYFVDDSPTKFIPDTEVKKEKTGEKKSAVIPILAGITATFVIAIIILGIFVIDMFTGGTGDEYKLPDFVGQNYMDVMNNEEYDGLYEFVVEWQDSSDYEQNQICDQTPEKGKSVKAGQKVTLIVSNGAKTVQIPNIYGYKKTRAKAALEEEGFKVKFAEEPSEDVDLDCVIKTDPQVGTTVAPGITVTVYISTGEEVELVDIPDLIGVKKNSVPNVLAAAGLKLGLTSEEYSDTQPKGFVCATNPSIDDTKQVPKGSSIDIVYSKGPNPNTDIEFELELPEYEDHGTAEVSFWNGSKQIALAEDEESNDPQLGSTVTFKISVPKEDLPCTLTVKYKIEGRYVNALRIDVDSKGKISVRENYLSNTSSDASSSN